jgi:FixJ family two-component response regulator
MKAFDIILVLDDNERRRASLSYLLHKGGEHAEVLSSVSELFIPHHEAAALLVSDDSIAFKPSEVLGKLEELGGWLPCLCYSPKVEVSSIVRCLRLGVLDYRVWPIESDELTNALAQLAADAAPRRKTLQQRSRIRQRLSSLSPRELQVVEAVVNGKSNKQLAKELGLSHRTVETHRKNAMAKFGEAKMVDIARFWAEAFPRR